MSNQTETVLDAMLKENTGRHMLDSGGAYGRAWEQNQSRDFSTEESSTLRVRGGKYPEIDVTHNVFHWLSERVRVAPSWQEKFDAYVEKADDAEGRTGWLILMEGFFDDLREQGHDVCAPFGGNDTSICDNTYNNECFLSQTLQFVAADVDGEEVILLQIHGGCDVRGGYTAPKAFIGNGYGDWSIFDYGRAGIYCDNREDCDANWSSDSGAHWYFDGGSGPNGLEKFKVIEHGETTEDGAVIESPTKGVIYVNEQKEAFCPCCGKGKLHASSY